MVLEESSTCVSCLHKQTPFFPFGLRGNHFGIRSSHHGLRRYRPISRPIFLVVRFNSFIHSFQYHSVHQVAYLSIQPENRQIFAYCWFLCIALLCLLSECL